MESHFIYLHNNTNDDIGVLIRKVVVVTTIYAQRVQNKNKTRNIRVTSPVKVGGDGRGTQTPGRRIIIISLKRALETGPAQTVVELRRT